ncbi:DEAD/DEAH box helicase family protein [Gluconacetobacter aggeris]|uniref:DEAD/DEAH box helicase family protein n=1 Tax=Gluconacetobacter aggeris TaxID=1286186 RepID=A0A7W4ISK4_9PROT|nr:DEAD/DEAH box helicase family protein [Gluconacetobacter aggeris]MBB2168309.1 DEAD/DEAH box helicase family protein [Gluconacetobacter aggeris]
MTSINDLSLAKGLTAKVEEACVGLENGNAPILDQVSEITAELLKWWFEEDFKDIRTFNFHPGQQQALLNVIYAHEVLGISTLQELYQFAASEVMLTSTRDSETIRAPKNAYPKYCLKMATGTGKTWVLQALMVWQILNAARAPDSPRFTRNFLVVAPGLIVYDRLLDAFMGKERDGKRDFSISDLSIFQELFIPDAYRDEVFRFVQGAVCPKEDIGRKVTAGGIIAISNWHVLSEEGEPPEDEEIEAPGAEIDPKAVVQSILPLTPGTSKGNDLNVLNRRYERGGILDYLKELPALMVFNDEAHHIHEFKREGEVTEVEWQKSLNLIAEPKGRRFVQVDFSATPYNEVGTGRNSRKSYFPHIVVDFDLKTAMRAGLVKSLVLDKRSEIGALSHEELDFKADRDENGNPMLSEGQRIMLRAGLTKLRKLEADFAGLDPDKHPKMLVVCEDTTVTPLVSEFMQLEGLADDEVLRVDSNRKGELKPDEWKVLRERLFDVDRHKSPRVIVSVLMLREGFDVNNICVIVPLRASSAGILLEQTIGRGLRLMWRGNEYDDIKRENRQLIRAGKTPTNMIDILSIVEHPAFQSFYDDLIQEGLAAESDDDDDRNTSGTGDLISVGLRSGFEEYDFAIPFILHEQVEELEDTHIEPASLEPFGAFTLDQLKSQLGHGERFHSEDVQARTRFGDYRVHGGVMTATGYNDYLARITRRITEAVTLTDTTGSAKAFANASKFPYIQINRAELAEGIDTFIRHYLFRGDMDPLADENWRVLLIDPVTDHVIKVWARAILGAEDSVIVADAEVAHRRLSEVPKLAMRESASLAVEKAIYLRLPYPARNGGLEQAFMETCERDASVEAFCKINEQKHTFARLRYIKEDGLPAFYSPDFFVRAGGAVYLVETKAQGQLTSPNVLRKRKAAVAWCDRINGLPAEARSEADWHYVLLGEDTFYGWRDKGGSIAELLAYARLRPVEDRGQAKFAF